MSTRELPFEWQAVKNPRRKNLGIAVKEGRVELRLPATMTEREGLYFLYDKRHWVTQKLAEQQRAERRVPDFSDGSSILYLGVPRTIRYQTDTALSVSLIDDQFECGTTETSLAQQQITEWLRREADQYLRRRAGELATQTGLMPKSVVVKNYKSRWGCCHADGRVMLNWRLIMTPPEVIDYVIIHELCHLKERNHSAKFWRLVSCWELDYKLRRRWLADHMQELNV